MAQLAKALPESEYRPVEAWISTFYGFQQNWLLDMSRQAMLCKCRQIGASFTYAGWAVLRGILADETVIISTTQDEADLVRDAAIKHAQVLTRLGSKWSANTTKGNSVWFHSGLGKITSLPSTSGGRSRSANVLLDEVGYYERPEKIWDAAAGAITHGKMVRVFSTPNGVGNWWHKLWSGKAPGWRRHFTDVDGALADGMPLNMQQLWEQALGDQRIFDQLFRGSFLDNDLQYIPTDYIERCSDDLRLYSELPGRCYAGLDIGESNDLTVLTVIKHHTDGVSRVQSIRTMKRTDNQGLQRMVDESFRRYQWSKLAVDKTGLGTFPSQELVQRYNYRVEPLAFTQQSKDQLATGAYSAFANSRVVIPRTDLRGVIEQPGEAQALRQDCMSVKRIVTAAGNVTYDAPHTKDGHADRFWSLALALYAASTAPGGKTVVVGR